MDLLNRSNTSNTSLDEIADKLQDARDVLAMDIDLDQHVTDDLLSDDVTGVPPVDLENVLGQFLEDDATSLTGVDDVSSIEQILLA